MRRGSRSVQQGLPAKHVSTVFNVPAFNVMPLRSWQHSSYFSPARSGALRQAVGKYSIVRKTITHVFLLISGNTNSGHFTSPHGHAKLEIARAKAISHTSTEVDGVWPGPGENSPKCRTSELVACGLNSSTKCCSLIRMERYLVTLSIST